MTRLLFGWIGLPVIVCVILLLGLFPVRPNLVQEKAGMVLIDLSKGMHKKLVVDTGDSRQWIIIRGKDVQDSVIMLVDTGALEVYKASPPGWNMKGMVAEGNDLAEALTDAPGTDSFILVGHPEALE